MEQETITLTQKQIKRLEVIGDANKGLLTVEQAAIALGLSTRQVQRLKKGVRDYGAAALIHKNSLKAPTNTIPLATREEIVALKKSSLYKDCNFCHFRDLLAEHHDIVVSYGTLYRLLTEEGFTSPKKRRKYKPHRRRKRRSRAGLLVQVDATPHDWFVGDRKNYALHGAIDDATGQVLALYMTKNECLHGYFEMMTRMVENFGIPCSIYADRHTIFQSPNTKKHEIDASIPIHKTQLGQALSLLDVELIPAKSPQAKGRIERLWDTLQSRLPIEFAIRKITTLEEANAFLADYIYAFNSEFAVEPEDTTPMFQQLPPHMNLKNIFCLRETRTLDAGGVFSFRNHSYKVVEGAVCGPLPAKTKVTVLASAAPGETDIRVAYKNFVFETLPFVPPKRKKKQKTARPAKKSIPKPGPNHPYRLGKTIANTMDWSFTDQEIMQMLEEAFLR